MFIGRIVTTTVTKTNIVKSGSSIVVSLLQGGGSSCECQGGEGKEAGREHDGGMA